MAPEGIRASACQTCPRFAADSRSGLYDRWLHFRLATTTTSTPRHERVAAVSAADDGFNRRRPDARTRPAARVSGSEPQKVNGSEV